MDQTDLRNEPQLERLRAFSERRPEYKETFIRWLVFNQDTNGFKGCFPKIGRNRYVDVQAFFERIKQLNVAR